MDRDDRNGAMWASHPTIPPSMPAALPPPFTQGRLIGIKILGPLVKGAGCGLACRLRDLQTNRIRPFYFLSLNTTSPPPQGKRKSRRLLSCFF